MKKENLKKNRTFYNTFFKRFSDFFISLVAIIILSPILLLLYIFNGIFVGFPTIFKQQRPGKNNKLFRLYKFRSMNNKKDKEGNLLPDSQRITFWGKLMRKTSLDELPQLFNILTGKMSIIGFRPRLIKDAIFYDKDVFESYTEKPGLTGPIQSTSRNENSWEEIFESDMNYNKNIKFSTDVKIFFKTFISVFKRGGDSRDNAEEDKKSLRDYYYADYLLKTGKITKEQYDYGMHLANEIECGNMPLEHHPELLDKKLFAEMQNHKHAIIVIKNKKNELLQYFDEKWNCLLFPNLKLSNESQKEQIIDYLSKQLNISQNQIQLKLKANKVHEKFSVSAQKNKVYNHFIYEIKIKNLPAEMTANQFEYGGNKYSWHTIENLENDENVKNTNQDILDFVKDATK